MVAIDRDSVTTYLNDHLGASIAALELIDRIYEVHVDSALGTLMSSLKAEITVEQDLLRSLIGAVGGSESTLAKSIGWIGEKLSRLKIGPGEGDSTGLMLFGALDALSIGFWGRRSLWRALDHLGIGASLPFDPNFSVLTRQADRHLDALEPFRLEASLWALTRAPISAA